LLPERQPPTVQPQLYGKTVRGFSASLPVAGTVLIE
jgi:hypothetical protein